MFVRLLIVFVTVRVLCLVNLCITMCVFVLCFFLPRSGRAPFVYFVCCVCMSLLALFKCVLLFVIVVCVLLLMCLRVFAVCVLFLC